MIGSVICKRIAPVGDVLVKLFPTGIIKNLDEKNTYFYGAISSETRALAGGCALSLTDQIPDCAIIHYVNVNADCRKSGVGTKLLETAIKSMKSAGVKYVIYREATDVPIKLILSYNFATKNGFIPVTEAEMIYTYKLEKVLSGKFVMKTMSKIQDLKHVAKIEDYRDRRIIKFNEIKEHGFYRLDKGSFDPALSGFYIEDDRIVGVLKVTREDNYIILGDVFAEKGFDKKEIFNALIEFVLVLATKDVKTENIVIQAEGEERGSYIKELLGEPDREVPAIELIRYL